MFQKTFLLFLFPKLCSFLKATLQTWLSTEVGFHFFRWRGSTWADAGRWSDSVPWLLPARSGWFSYRVEMHAERDNPLGLCFCRRRKIKSTQVHLADLTTLNWLAQAIAMIFYPCCCNGRKPSVTVICSSMMHVSLRITGQFRKAHFETVRGVAPCLGWSLGFLASCQYVSMPRTWCQLGVLQTGAKWCNLVALARLRGPWKKILNISSEHAHLACHSIKNPQNLWFAMKMFFEVFAVPVNPRQSFRFLVFRFRLDSWWYGVPLLVRGLTATVAAVKFLPRSILYK